MTNNIIVLVDMDCFYCQVEARLNPTLQGKPVAVVQYNQWMGGGIIAVNYEARKFGVTRGLRGVEARKKCPEINLVSVPTERGKADLTKYRDAGREVVDVLCQFSKNVERASIDEAYLDITETVGEKMLTVCKVNPEQLPTTFIVGCSDTSSNDEEQRQNSVKSWLSSIYGEGILNPVQMKLAVAGLVVEEIRAAVYKNTGFHCSAGIAHNKILSKLACGLHKPNCQSILSQEGVAELFKTLPVKKVRSLGGKFGDMVVQRLGCKVMADLLQFSENQLQQKFDEKTGSWLYNIARGIDNEPVTPRLISKSIGCCKKFPGKQALATKNEVQKWTLELASEVSERVTKDMADNKRRATSLTVSYSQCGESHTRSGPLSSYDPERIAADAIDLIKRSNIATPADDNAWMPPLQFLGISVGKFVEDGSLQKSTIHNFFKPVSEGSLYESKNQAVNDPCTSRVEHTNNKAILELEIMDDSSNQCEENVLEVKTQEYDTFITLDEIFPDLQNVDENIIPHLPKMLQEELRKRLNQVKTGTKECPVCHELISLSVLSKHMITHTALHESDDSRKCHVCDQQFAVSKIAEHINTHNLQTPKENLSEHRRFHRKHQNVDSKMIGCPICANHFPGNQIDKHMLSHSCQGEQIDCDKPVSANIRSIKCPICGECVEDLSAHKKSHQIDLSERVLIPEVSSSTNITDASTNKIEFKKCSKCEQQIAVSGYLEHLDFHTAQELDKELNCVRPPLSTANIPPAKKKRGRPNKKVVAAPDKKLQCITAFFTPK